MAYIEKINNEEFKIKEGIKKAMESLMLDRMPTSYEIRSLKIPKLDSLISKNGGYPHWANKLGLQSKKNIVKLSRDEAKSLIIEVVNELKLNRMPSGNEIRSVFNNYVLHNYISRHGGFRQFAEELNLSIKESETQLGQDYEQIAISILKDKGFKIEKMSTGHPFDLLINNVVKVDVKVARPHMLRGNDRVHTFGINKKYGSCDIYITVALDELDNIEKFLIIPSHHLRVVTLCIGKSSKYDVYDKKFDYIDKYSDFYKVI